MNKVKRLITKLAIVLISLSIGQDIINEFRFEFLIKRILKKGFKSLSFVDKLYVLGNPFIWIILIREKYRLWLK